MALVELQALEGHDDRVWHLAWSPNGKIDHSIPYFPARLVHSTIHVPLSLFA